LSKLDLPSLEQRQERTADSMKKAQEDLKNARAQDIPASQQDAKKQLERLEQALYGQKPADEKASELARREEQLAQEAAKLASQEKPSPDKMRDLLNQQRQIAQETQNLQLHAYDAPQRMTEAVDATKKAEQSAREATDAASKPSPMPNAKKDE